VRSRRHYRNCISWLYGVHLRIAAFRDEANNASVKEEFDVAEDIRDFTQDVVRGYVVEKSEARVELQLERMDRRSSSEGARASAACTSTWS